MKNESDAIELIEKAIEAAQKSLPFQYLASSDQPNDYQDIWTIAKALGGALENHPAIPPTSGNRFFYGNQVLLIQGQQAKNLLDVAIARGAKGALDWYLKIRATTSTPVRIVGLVYGLHTQGPTEFSNGLTLIPVTHLTDSPNSVFFNREIIRAPGFNIPSAIIQEIPDAKSEDFGASYANFRAITDLMHKTINAFTLDDSASPILAQTWPEFVDKDMELTAFGRGWNAQMSDGAHPRQGININAQALRWVEKYLGLPQAVQDACDVALARLNVARRRYTAGDKAIDGAICLESLLSGGGKGELTYKLSVRTALLLGKKIEERRAIMKDVKDFYSLRSDVVHGGRKVEKERDRRVAETGLAHCLSTLRAVVESKAVPDPASWELTGGPNWNRFDDATDSTGIASVSTS